MSHAVSNLRMYCLLYLVLSLTGCNSLIGLDAFVVADTADTADAGLPMAECQTHLDCNADPKVPMICRKLDGVCVALESEDCRLVSGDPRNDAAIVIGSMFSYSGSQESTSRARENSARLAVEEVNAVGGVPRSVSSADAHPLVLVSCDASVNLLRAGRHLVDELAVPAIVGPNLSQDVLDLSTRVSIPGGTAVLTPTALASSIADLLDEGLTTQMVPTDVQRAPLMILQINAIEAELARTRAADTIKLGLIFRDDALGTGTRLSLNGLILNGKSLADPVNLGSNVRIDAYDFGAANQQAMVLRYVEFAPDVVVLAGTTEMIEQVILPLERAWPDTNPRPYYMLVDGLKVSDLLRAVQDDEDLRKRIRGTGVTSAPESLPVYGAFYVSYALRFPDGPNGASGMGPTYDATYAVALALAAMHDQPVDGHSVAAGLRKLWAGGTQIGLQGTNALAAFSRLAKQEPISALGTFGPLAWAPNGSVMGGNLEMWCIGRSADRLVFGSSGLTQDLATGVLHGEYVQCP